MGGRLFPSVPWPELAQLTLADKPPRPTEAARRQGSSPPAASRPKDHPGQAEIKAPSHVLVVVRA